MTTSVPHDQRIIFSLIRLGRKYPGVPAMALRHMRFVPDGRIPIAAVAGRTCRYNPELVETLDNDSLDRLLFHEAAHVFLRHTVAGRRAAKARRYAGLPYRQSVMNRAVDLQVVSFLQDMGVSDPDRLLTWPDDSDDDDGDGDAEPFVIEGISPDPAMTWRTPLQEIYRRLFREQPPGQSDDTGIEPGDPVDVGGGKTIVADVHPDTPTDNGGNEDDGGEGDEVPEPAIVSAMRDIAEKLAGEGIGEAMRRLLEERERADLADVLERHLSAAARRHADMASWQRVDRAVWGRYGFAWPDRRRPTLGTVVIVLDTSGSISVDELRAFSGIVQHTLANYAPQRLIVLGLDIRPEIIIDSDDLGLDPDRPWIEQMSKSATRGGGGTDMPAAFRWARSAGVEPDVMVILTDGFTSFGSDPGYPVIWASTTDRNSPWGERVRVDLKGDGQ